MNLLLRQANREGVIDAGQHDAIVGLVAPAPEEVDGLPVELAALWASWARFGPPMMEAGLGGVEDRRPALYAARQEYLDREVRSRGLDPEAWERIWSALDKHAIDQLDRRIKAREK